MMTFEDMDYRMFGIRADNISATDNCWYRNRVVGSPLTPQCPSSLSCVH